MKGLQKHIQLYRIVLITVSLFLSAILYNLLILPLGIVTGGTDGVATLSYYLYGIEPSIILMILSVFSAIISLMYLGIERTAGSLVACFAYPFIVKLTSGISNVIFIDTSDIFLIVIFAGLWSGIASGLMYKSGYSSGAFSMIYQVIFEKFKISVAKSSLVSNMIIVATGSIFFGINKALYAIILIYISNIIIDKVLLGISNNKAFYIMTKKEKEIKEYIIEELHHTVTTFEVKGGFLESKRRVMLTIIPSREYYYLTEGIRKLDPDAFFVATDSYQVEGAK